MLLFLMSQHQSPAANKQRLGRLCRPEIGRRAPTVRRSSQGMNGCRGKVINRRFVHCSRSFSCCDDAISQGRTTNRYYIFKRQFADWTPQILKIHTQLSGVQSASPLPFLSFMFGFVEPVRSSRNTDFGAEGLSPRRHVNIGRVIINLSHQDIVDFEQYTLANSGMRQITSASYVYCLQESWTCLVPKV